MQTADMISQNLKFLEPKAKKVIAYTINGKEAGDPWNEILVIFNSNTQPVRFPIPDGAWRIALAGEKFELKNPKAVQGSTISIAELSAWVLFRLFHACLVKRPCPYVSLGDKLMKVYGSDCIKRNYWHSYRWWRCARPQPGDTGGNRSGNEGRIQGDWDSERLGWTD
jgi:hypothetical protein